MFTYLKEKTIGIASTVGSTVVGGGQAAVQTVFSHSTSAAAINSNTAGNNSQLDISGSF